MKIGSNKKIKLLNFRFVLLILIIVSAWVISSNSLFFNNVLNKIADRLSPQLGIYEQTTLTELSDVDDYIKGMMAGLTDSTEFPTIDIQVKQKNILILNSERENGGRSYVPAKFSIYEGGEIKDLKGKIRGKGDRDIHKESFATMSLRVNLKGDDRLFGLEEFSVQDPIMRGYTWELLVADIMKSKGLLTLQSKLANYSFNGESRGLYVFEEVPSKVTIERNLRKSGPIFGLNEDYGPALDGVLDVYDSKDWVNSGIYTNAREKLLMQFAAVRGGDVFSEDIFDLDEWASYFALIDLFGTYHGALLKSVKFYFNPVVGKFQPLLFDAHKLTGFSDYIIADHKLNPESVQCEWTCYLKDFYLGFLNNKYFFDAYLKYLEEYSSLEFIEQVESIYIDDFKKIDQKFYASLSRSDGVRYRGFGLYYFKFSEIENRRELLTRKLAKLKEHKETFTFLAPMNAKEKQLISTNDIIAPDGTVVLNIDNQSLKGTAWNFKDPTILIMTGDTNLQGLSKEEPLNIVGPVMLVQEGGTITLDNVNFIMPMYIDVSNRQWSGAVNIINSKANLAGVLIKESMAEDAINFISSTYKISDLMIFGSKSDAIDFDFSDGHIDKISCYNIGNDCVDASESKVDINYLMADGVQDKGVSAGENSDVKIKEFTAKNIAVGLVSKDGSHLDVDRLSLNSVQLAVSTFKKKPEYSSPSLTINEAINIDAKLQMQALVSNDSKIDIPSYFDILIEKSNVIESRMYGVEFGKATEK